MLSLTDNHRNANLNCNEILLYNQLEKILKGRQYQPELLYTIGRSINWYNHSGKQPGNIEKI